MTMRITNPHMVVRGGRLQLHSPGAGWAARKKGYTCSHLHTTLFLYRALVTSPSLPNVRAANCVHVHLVIPSSCFTLRTCCVASPTAPHLGFPFSYCCCPQAHLRSLCSSSPPPSRYVLQTCCAHMVFPQHLMRLFLFT